MSPLHFMILLPWAQLICNDLSVSRLFSIIHPTHSHSCVQDSGITSSCQNSLSMCCAPPKSGRTSHHPQIYHPQITLRSIGGPGSGQFRVLVIFSSLGFISNATNSLFLFNKNEFSYFSLYKSSSFFKGWFKYCFLPGIIANCSSLFSESLFY